MNDPAAPLIAAFAAGLPDPRPDTLGLAVSGGSDSMAMLLIAARYARGSGLSLRAVTVDHGLRPEAAAEAALVAETCARLAIPHDILRWDGAGAQGNLQAAARGARYALMADWARAHGIAHVALAHTRDDIAETFLMRLARGAGVDGLSAMAGARKARGITWLRPLRDLGRAALQDFLRSEGVEWCDDPSNDDRRFDRARARQALVALAPLGLDVTRLSDVAAILRDASDALQVQTRAAARTCARVAAGDILFDRAAFAAQPVEIRRRLVAQALQWIASAEYAPRGASLSAFIAAIEAGQKATLHGCLGLPARDSYRLTREYNAVRDLRAPLSAAWDGRWRLAGPDMPGAQVAALGETGLADCPYWRDAGRPRDSLLASPAVWQDGRLIAAPLARAGDAWLAATVTECDFVREPPISH